MVRLRCAGWLHTRTSVTMHDDREEEAAEHLEAHISAFTCNATQCSFYTAAGQVSGEQLLFQFRRCLCLYVCALAWQWEHAWTDGGLASSCHTGYAASALATHAAVPQLTDLARALAPEDGSTRVLGWFVQRRGTWLVPSIRDRAVCAALPSLLALLPGAQARSARPCTHVLLLPKGGACPDLPRGLHCGLPCGRLPQVVAGTHERTSCNELVIPSLPGSPRGAACTRERGNALP
jgi:hypothetical protein